MDLYEKIKKIEALIERASTEGERNAAIFAKLRLAEKMQESPMEFKISSQCIWEKRLFGAICRKNGFHTYRYQRQKYTTSMVMMRKSVMNNVIWPEYLKYCKLLGEMVDEIANSLVDKIHSSEEEETVISGQLTQVSSTT